MRFILSVLLVILLSGLSVNAQRLKAGFDADEYLEVLQRCAAQVDARIKDSTIKDAHEYRRVYRSPEVGLHNKWELWQSKDKSVIVINLRGTTADMDSWLENFYCAMIPATGSLKLSNKYTFNYKFASDSKSTVHVGWALGVGSMAPDILEKIQAYYQQGAKQIMVEGHSQGGALAFLLTSYLYYQIADGKLPGDIQLKTYCSAAPKPGNLYYAYDFDYITRSGWAYTVVNAADWVPETPFSIQTLGDMNEVNPFTNVKSILKKQKLLVRVYMSHVYNQLDRSTRKAQHKYEKRLGKTLYKRIKKYLPEYEEPEYAPTLNYMRAGNPIVLQPFPDYYRIFPDNKDKIFTHHFFEPYYFLTRMIYK